jgi:adenylosuccinate lyase
MKALKWFWVGSLVAALAVTPAFSGLTFAADKMDKKVEREEMQVAPDQVPAAVKATIDKETAKGATAGPVMKETEKGKTFYEVELTKNGKSRYLHIASDGKIVKREGAKREAREERKDMKKEEKK